MDANMRGMAATRSYGRYAACFAFAISKKTGELSTDRRGKDFHDLGGFPRNFRTTE
jgi:hypothetical protein